MILYKPPSVWGLIRGAAINLLLPFVNGLMLGFGELFAHEAAFRLGWSNTKVCVNYNVEKILYKCLLFLSLLQIFPMYRRTHPIGPGVEVRELPSERRRVASAAGLNDTAALE
jgi:hypothetical protein